MYIKYDRASKAMVGVEVLFVWFGYNCINDINNKRLSMACFEYFVFWTSIYCRRALVGQDRCSVAGV